MRGDEQNQLKTPAPLPLRVTCFDPTFSQINLGGQSLKVLETNKIETSDIDSK
jgi:hypothetical protein